MKLVQVVPLELGPPTLATLLDRTEQRLRGKGTTFVRQKKGRWVHRKHAGWINLSGSKAGVLEEEIHSKKPESEWQLLQAFVGYLNRHLGDKIHSITILFYPR